MYIIKYIKTFFFRKRIRGNSDKSIDPDEIFLDSSNLPDFDTDQFEGRLEKPISQKTLLILFLCIVSVVFVYGAKLWIIQVSKGEQYAKMSERNRLRNILKFSERGVIYDRNGEVLASNVINPDTSDFPLRKYISAGGFAHILGYVKYPSKDKQGFYYKENYTGEDGVEKYFDSVLSGENGVKIIETDALGKIQSESVTKPPVAGENINLSIDAKLQEKFYEYISKTAIEQNYVGGAGVVIDVTNGEIVAMTSYPEFNSNDLSSGNSEAFSRYLRNSSNPFLDRATTGLYTPGSIIKPFIAVAALEEDVINPNTQILSTGQIAIPNPYFKDQETVFKDWKAHGWVDMRRAIAVSSDVYFYEIGGGFQGQKGIGIEKIDKYAKLFGFGSPTGFIGQEESGLIPTPEWKEKTFNGDPWRIGNTYHTSIGQYGFLVTPIQVVRSIASIANDGKLFTPILLKGANDGNKKAFSELALNKENFKIIRDGMRMAVSDGGTAAGLNVPYVDVAAKTGTAELGSKKQFVNSWVVGFFPYVNPKYAFAVIMERGPVHNTIGGVYVMRQMFDWMAANTPEYFK